VELLSGQEHQGSAVEDQNGAPQRAGQATSETDKAKAAEYSRDKEQIQKKAGELSQEAKRDLHTHHILAHSVTLFQIAIAVGAISVLTRRRLFWFVSLGFGAGGLFFVGQSLLPLGGQ